MNMKGKLILLNISFYSDLSNSVKETPKNSWKNKRKLLKLKKSRIIVRNLSFKTTEQELRKHFATYGDIVELSLPKKEDGKLKGFAFVQYNNIGSALRAVKYMNGKDVCDRKVVVDMAVSKAVYTQTIKDDDDNSDLKQTEVKKEKSETKETKPAQKKQANEVAPETDEIEEDDDDDDDEEGSNNEEDEEEEDNLDDDEDEDDKKIDEILKKRQSKKSDVVENKTVFIRNLDLETTEKTLSDVLKVFGPLEYCKICMDDYTGMSKGTAFAKFKNKEHALKCIEEGQQQENPKFYVDGQQLSVSLAVPRNEVAKMQAEKMNKHKDKRNLYLAKEGLIYPNSPAAVGVSQNDIKRRVAVSSRV